MLEHMPKQQGKPELSSPSPRVLNSPIHPTLRKSRALPRRGGWMANPRGDTMTGPVDQAAPATAVDVPDEAVEAAAKAVYGEVSPYYLALTRRWMAAAVPILRRQWDAEQNDQISAAFEWARSVADVVDITPLARAFGALQ